ncbi:MAG: peptidase M75 [Prevotellaceae bacterium]|jgi:uncharacterized iron-regulated protein|nr:peptidase M75 [Prevotellaceae bacterium]
MQKLKLFSFIAVAVLGFTACGDQQLTTSENLAMLEQIVPDYVDNTIIPTYKALADNAIELEKALVMLKNNRTDANVFTACKEWVDSRKFWEQSEAFLFGAAADFGIDPHIDTWPLDLTALVAELGNADHIAAMAAEDGAAWAGEKLGAGLLGFHGIEYILFRNGQKRPFGDIRDNELIYAIAVAGDLRNQCIRLEAAWAGKNNVSAEKQLIINNFELGVTIANGQSYGENMKNAGKAGSTYKSFTDAAEDIIQGCTDISDEVAAMKIGKPYKGEDINYIESPYSHNSITDFVDNVESIRNAYLGGVEGKRDNSLHGFFDKVNKNFDNRVLAAIDEAIDKISAIQNFETNPASAQAGIAIEALNSLTSIFEEAQLELRKAVE